MYVQEMKDYLFLRLGSVMSFSSCTYFVVVLFNFIRC